MAKNTCWLSILGLPTCPTLFGGKSNSTSDQNLSLTRKRQSMAIPKLQIKITSKNNHKNQTNKKAKSTTQKLLSDRLLLA